MSTSPHAELLTRWLRRRDPRQPVTTVETHISVVAFQGDRAYKLKKPVRYPFIDLSTPALRLIDCEREVALNRRLSPDIYLGIEPIVENGAVVDHVVAMRRLPETKRLDALAQRGDGVQACIERVAALLARFHAESPTGGSVDGAATRDAVAELWERAFAECAPFVGTTFSESTSTRVVTLVHRYLAGRLSLFDERIAAGRARDGHGDLLANDIFCLPDGPRVLDCLEFDDRLRYGDVLSDVAFLAMDLERLGCGDTAHRFLDEYRRLTNDEWPRSLEDFYIAYRAHVRAKIAALTENEASARQLLRLATDHLERGRVRIILVGGPPASGKTGLARALGDATGWPVLHSDEIRKQLAGLAVTADARAPLDEGIYTLAWTARTYTALCYGMQHNVTRGQSVIVDATWGDPHWRDTARRVASETSSDLIALYCRLPLDLAVARAAARAAGRRDASDADASLTATLSARFGRWPDATAIDMQRPMDDIVASALDAIGRFSVSTTRAIE